MGKRFIIICLFVLFSMRLCAEGFSPLWYTKDADNKAVIEVSIFLSSSCPHCHKADLFFQDLADKTPWIKVNRHIINQDKDALVVFNQFLIEQHSNNFAVPAVFFCDSRWVGFDTELTTGKDLIRGLNYCKKQIDLEKKLSKTSVEILRHWAHANPFDAEMNQEYSSANYLLLLVFLDAFNPCALFVFILFCAVLFIHNSSASRFGAGVLFCLGVCLVHYFQQTHTNSYFVLLSWLRLPALLVGLLGFYLIYYYYRHNLIPKISYLFIFLCTLFTAAYQQTCLMNWSYIFQQWLYNQPIPSMHKGILQLVYQILYGLPLLAAVGLYLLMTQRGFFVHLRPKLQVLGLVGLSMLLLFLIFYPWALSKLILSLSAFPICALIGVFWSKYQEKMQNTQDI